MRLAFALFRYFPYGGLQRDCARIASTCMERGHEVRIYTSRCEGEIPGSLDIRVLRNHRLRNHARDRTFHKSLFQALSDSAVDLVVGFNKMPGLDVYYCGDGCYASDRRALSRLTLRHRHFMHFERAVFSPDSSTRILVNTEQDATVFMEHYGTQRHRFAVLPPDIEDRGISARDREEVRDAVRRELCLRGGDKLVLMVGSGFQTKGVDRSVRAIACLPDELRQRTCLAVIGRGRTGPMRRLANRLRVADRVRFLGGRSDVPRFLVGADLLLHPARREAAGRALLEAVVAGLPVLATATCGYATHVAGADAGRLIASPFQQRQLNEALAAMLVSERRRQWSENGLAYGRTRELHGMPHAVASEIELTKAVSTG